MAKVNTQNIPAELLDLYRAALGEERPDKGVRKRYPYHVPTVQTETGHPTPAQKIQRGRFKTAIEKFNATSPADRQRWYDAMPVWGSFLWYYNYFILSALTGNANLDGGGIGVIKSIQYVTGTLLAGAPADVNIVITTVDPAKTVVMLFGAGYEWDEVLAGVAISWAVYPYPKAVIAEQLTIRASGSIDINAAISAIVIEYI